MSGHISLPEIPIDLPRPRSPDIVLTPGFLAIKQQLRELIKEFETAKRKIPGHDKPWSQISLAAKSAVLDQLMGTCRVLQRQYLRHEHLQLAAIE